jgi:chitin-binding protein
MIPHNRRAFLMTAGGVVAAGALLDTAAPAGAGVSKPAGAGVAAGDPTAQASWQLRWSPDPTRDGLAAFEGVEDDRCNSHPAGQPHIYVADGNYRFNMHLVDRDCSTDRQRQEVKGMRSPAGGDYVVMGQGQTWRFTQQMYVPSSLKATTTFTHIMQLKRPGTGTGPIMVISLRRVSGRETIELKEFSSNILVGRTDLGPLKNKWIDIEFEVRINDAPNGWARWVVRDGSTTVLDVNRSGLDTWLGDRVRPKWGIYRSLGDTSGSLQDCYLLYRNMRAYQMVATTSTRYEAENATIYHGQVESDHAGFSGTGFVNYDNEVGSYVQWTVNAATAGTYTARFRHANGTTTNRPMDIAVNGALAADELAFPGTGDWASWQTVGVTVPLVAGSNTIRATATTANGGPNVDYLELA